jgi:hypothetical protein
MYHLLLVPANATHERSELVMQTIIRTRWVQLNKTISETV